MLATVDWEKTPTYFEGRNGMFSQTGVEIMTRDQIDPCNKDPRPGPPGVMLTPMSKRGVARGCITIPLKKIDEFIRHLKAAKKELRNAKPKLDSVQHLEHHDADSGGDSSSVLDSGPPAADEQAPRFVEQTAGG